MAPINRPPALMARRLMSKSTAPGYAVRTIRVTMLSVNLSFFLPSSLRTNVRNRYHGANKACSACSVVSVAYVGAQARSEEHTSELQSQSNLVCRLLLEKKKHFPVIKSNSVGTRRRL